jgi:hypothetical protein
MVIFRTDFTGDGTVEPMPDPPWQFDRGINASNINQVIGNYNSKVAGQAACRPGARQEWHDDVKRRQARWRRSAYCHRPR